MATILWLKVRYLRDKTIQKKSRIVFLRGKTENVPSPHGLAFTVRSSSSVLLLYVVVLQVFPLLSLLIWPEKTCLVERNFWLLLLLIFLRRGIWAAHRFKNVSSRIRINKTVERILNNCNFQTSLVAKIRTPSSAKVQHFYALPKTHKKELTIRPIVSACGGILDRRGW